MGCLVEGAGRGAEDWEVGFGWVWEGGGGGRATFEIVDEQDPLTQSLYREFTDVKYKANGPSVRCYPVSTHFPG